MAMNLKMADCARQKSPWFRIGRFLFLAALFVALFLLGQSMVHHRFFRGGRLDQHGTLRP
jgi:hypothetical protein